MSEEMKSYESRPSQGEPICGIDEAGRGPIAGPVTAAAVVLGPQFERLSEDEFDITQIRDSKKLSSKARSRIAEHLFTYAAVGVGWAWPGEIDRLNIHHATLLAMKRAFEELSSPPFPGSVLVTPKSPLFSPGSVLLTPNSPLFSPGSVLVDGKFTPDLNVPSEAVVKGDSKVREISAASIIAKTVRDLWMIRYSRIEPAWEFDKHKGYPTARHIELCNLHGLSPIHRRSFRFKKV